MQIIIDILFVREISFSFLFFKGKIRKVNGLQTVRTLNVHGHGKWLKEDWKNIFFSNFLMLRVFKRKCAIICGHNPARRCFGSCCNDLSMTENANSAQSRILVSHQPCELRKNLRDFGTPAPVLKPPYKTMAATTSVWMLSYSIHKSLLFTTVDRNAEGCCCFH